MTHQTFYIEENVATNTMVNVKLPTGATCDSNPGGSSSCEIVASDVDSDSSGFQFIQAITQDPFVITKAATRHAVGKDAFGNDAFNVFTTVQYVSNSIVLDYESGNTDFDLSVYVQDSDGARTVNECMVTIIVVDANDKPSLNLPEKCNGKLCVDIDENNNEGSGSDRNVNLLNYVEDPDAPAKWHCCASSAPFVLLVTPSADACTLSKFQATTTGFTALATKFNFENNDSCDLLVKITDKGGAVSENELVHIKINDINDPPQDVGLTSLCTVEENTIQLTSLPESCQLTCTDEDDNIHTYLKSSPSGTTGVAGHFFSTVAGNTDAEKWSTLNYFNVETNGRFTIAQVPDYEIAQSLTFDVFARDNKGRMSAKKTVTIQIKDVNEPPIIHSTMKPEDLPLSMSSGRVDGDNKLCTAKFTIQELKKDGAQVISGQSATPLYDPAIGSELPLNFLAADPDQSATSATDWKTVIYSLTAGYFDSDAFEIDASLGTITSKPSAFGSIDFELLNFRPGVPDQSLRINVVASDAGGKATDCDIYVTVVDVNEPPTINHIDSNFGESTARPFVFDSTAVNVGENIGSELPAVDPDTGANDIASCREAELETTGANSADDRDLFGITTACQIYVKQITSGTKNLQSGTGTEYYTLYIEAYDKGSVSGGVLSSDKRMYHIHGKDGLISPVFDTGDIMFKQFENSGVVGGQASASTNDYSYWNIDGPPKKLFVACTDSNVFQRGTGSNVPALAGEQDPACSTYTQQAACESSNPVTGCHFEQATKTCVTRQQSLRYQVVASTTFPEIPESNYLTIDSMSAKLSTASSSTSNYESLLLPNPDIHCDLGPPVRSGDGSSNNLYKWIGRYPNGVKGVCRMFDNTMKKSTGKKSKMGYLDAAALCAKGGSRLPTLNELETAVADRGSATAVTSTLRGGQQGVGNFGLRPLNIIDLWNWKNESETTGTATNGLLCADGSTEDPCPSRSQKQDTEERVNVWTYNSKQAKFSTEHLSPMTDIYANPTSASKVSEVTGAINSQEELPVLCFVGSDYVNHKWIGNDNTPASYTQKVRKPLRGYSTLVRCMDTSDFTISEPRFEYSPQSQKDEKYLFVEIENVPEDPFFESESLEVFIDENNNVGSLVVNLVGQDEDPGDAMGLTFSLVAGAPSTLAFELGSPEILFPYQSSRNIPLNIMQDLDFESQPVHTMSVTITDASQRTATQSITIRLKVRKNGSTIIKCFWTKITPPENQHSTFFFYFNSFLLFL